MSTLPSNPTTLPALFEAVSQRFAGNTLVLEKHDGAWQPTTYAQMRALVHRCAAGFLALGLQKGDRVALIAEGRREWPVAELGILYAGGVTVPISVKIEELPELRFRLAHSGCRMVVASAAQGGKLAAIRADLPDLETFVLLDDPEEPSAGTITFAELLARGDAFAAARPDAVARSWRGLKGDDSANICYTSGTTADPKGIVLTHRNYTANIAQAAAMYPLPPDALLLQILPWDHAFAHTCGIYALASTGGAFACVPLGKTPMETLRNIPASIRETRPTLLLSVPALAKTFRKGVEKGVRDKGLVARALFRAGLATAIAYNGLGCDRGRGARALLKPLVALFDALVFRKIRDNFGGRLEYIVGGGALLDLDLQRFFYAIGIPMYQGYGLTEAAPAISSNTPGRHRLGSSGPLVPDLELRIRDEAGRDLPAGRKGEIVVKGENVMPGYWKNEKATAEVLQDGWLKTGDLGWVDDDGFLYVVGRAKSLLIGYDGEKYSPEGMEEALVEHSRFIDQAMLHNDHSPSTVALIVPNREALVEWMRRHDLAPGSAFAEEAVLRRIGVEVNALRRDGRHAGRFPERWLPTTFGVLAEPFTEQNRLLNSTLKMVRSRIEDCYRDRIAALHSAEGASPLSPMNREALQRLLQ